MRGIIALPTIRNTAGYDIVATTRDGARHANVQVKTSGQWVNNWPICDMIESVKDGDDDYNVVLRRNRKNDAIECYMLKGREMKEWLEGEKKWYEAKGASAKVYPVPKF
jgi:hypothetical protein